MNTTYFVAAGSEVNLTLQNMGRRYALFKGNVKDKQESVSR